MLSLSIYKTPVIGLSGGGANYRAPNKDARSTLNMLNILFGPALVSTGPTARAAAP